MEGSIKLLPIRSSSLSTLPKQRAIFLAYLQTRSKSKPGVTALPIVEPPRAAITFTPVISLTKVTDIFSSLPARCRRKDHRERAASYLKALMMNNGLTGSGNYMTVQQIGDALGISKQMASKRVNKALYLIRADKPAMAALEKMWQSALALINQLLASELIISQAEIKQALINQNVANKEEEKHLIALLYLLSRVLDRPLAPYYINIRTGHTATDIKDPDVLLCRDVDQFKRLIALYFEEKNGSIKKAVWTIEEYQALLAEKLGITISGQRLRIILESHPKFTIEDNIVYADKRDLNRDQIRAKIRKTIKRHGKIFGNKRSLHYARIAEHMGLAPEVAYPLVSSFPEFVLVGNGIYGLAKDFPGIEKTPYPDVRRRSGTFAAIYFALQNSQGMLRASEIYKATQAAGFRWTEAAIVAILSDERYRSLLTVEKRQETFTPAQDRVVNILAQKGQLHYRQIARLTETSESAIHYALSACPDVIPIGQGYYDLLASHPDISGVIPFPDIPKAQSSQLFAPLYCVLRDSNMPLSTREIYHELGARGYRCSRDTILKILRHMAYRDLFQQDEDGRYSVNA
ncbi:MAG: hypothetical protein KKA31_01505 [Candidatus Margulisbacteria bacterium]|nr:hypothetical protein [Candidatus Margulisiibacteriota bacterium]